MKVRYIGRPQGKRGSPELREVQAEITTVVWDPVVCPANRR